MCVCVFFSFYLQDCLHPKATKDKHRDGLAREEEKGRALISIFFHRSPMILTAEQQGQLMPWADDPEEQHFGQICREQPSESDQGHREMLHVTAVLPNWSRPRED